MTKEAVAEKYKEICESGQLNQGTFMPKNKITSKKNKKKKSSFVPWILSLMIITIATTMVVALDVGGIYSKFLAPKSITSVPNEEKTKQEQLREYETSLNSLGDVVIASLGDVEKQAQELEVMSQTLGTKVSDMAELVKIYEEMSPIVAADVMASLDTDMTVSILRNMGTDRIATILSLMNPDDAAKVTKSLYPQ